MTCEEFKAVMAGSKPPWGYTVAEQSAVLRHMDDCPQCLAQIEKIDVKGKLEKLSPTEQAMVIAASTEAARKICSDPEGYRPPRKERK